MSEAYSNGDYLPDWRFNTSTGFRIRFHFNEFHFYESIGYHSALEIGDGLIRGTGTRLAHFRGSEVPMDVTSVSNAAWMQVYDPYTIHLSNLAIVSFSKPVII